MNMLAVSNSLPVAASPQADTQYLMPDQVDALVTAFQSWYDNSRTDKTRTIRGRYWLTFLLLRFTGARIGEVLLVDETKDIDYRAAEIKLVTLKRHNKDASGKKKRKSQPIRLVPVPHIVISEISSYLAQYPEQRGKIFNLDQGNFRRKFSEISDMAGIEKELAHPHILRHTRAIELLRSGVPVTGVQSLLGHSSLNTTAIYLRLSNHETKQIMKQVGLL